MTRRILVALIFAILLLGVGASQWTYLDHGYTLGVAINGGPVSSSHIGFPWSRKLALLALGAAAFGALWLFASSHKLDRAAAWATLALGLLVALFDVREYGTMGSPTTLWAVLLLLALALTVQLSAPRAEDGR
jgi:hypothetical protein